MFTPLAQMTQHEHEEIPTIFSSAFSNGILPYNVIIFATHIRARKDC